MYREPGDIAAVVRHDMLQSIELAATSSTSPTRLDGRMARSPQFGFAPAGAHRDTGPPPAQP